jgi:hypothetical protein
LDYNPISSAVLLTSNGIHPILANAFPKTYIEPFNSNGFIYFFKSKHKLQKLYFSFTATELEAIRSHKKP